MDWFFVLNSGDRQPCNQHCASRVNINNSCNPWQTRVRWSTNVLLLFLCNHNMIRNILVLVFLLPRWIWCSCPNTWRLLGFSVLGAFPTSHSSNMGDSRRIGVKQVLLRQRQIQRSSRNFTESDLLRMGWKSRKDASSVFHTRSSRYIIILHVFYLCRGRIEEVHDNIVIDLLDGVKIKIRPSPVFTL